MGSVAGVGTRSLKSIDDGHHQSRRIRRIPENNPENRRRRVRPAAARRDPSPHTRSRRRRRPIRRQTLRMSVHRHPAGTIGNLWRGGPPVGRGTVGRGEAATGEVREDTAAEAALRVARADESTANSGWFGAPLGAPTLARSPPSPVSLGRQELAEVSLICRPAVKPSYSTAEGKSPIGIIEAQTSSPCVPVASSACLANPPSPPAGQVPRTQAVRRR